MDVPQIDAGSVVLFADQGRLELGGRHLEGTRLRWQASTDGKSGGGSAHI